ncbi:MAG: hypothetical protein WBP57_08415 [Ignavibacteria bacterium]|jgi:hypothetical protein|nr:MAG: hypothetical protein UZ04_CHB001001455 [Chlorobi bacterium OLB4]MBV6399588.1 hypothetical protein [Ignavibacteria bacterium]
MPKRYVNGYNTPSILLVHNVTAAQELIELSFKMQALKEFYEKISVTTKLIDGSKKKKVRYYDYAWLLDYKEYAEKDDLLLIQRIENAETDNKTIYLTPHKDYPWRRFRVLVKDELRELDLHYHHGGRELTANKSFHIGFVNAEKITKQQFVDPDYVPVMAAISCEEF